MYQLHALHCACTAQVHNSNRLASSDHRHKDTMLMPEALPSINSEQQFQRQAIRTELTARQTEHPPVSGMARLQQLASFGRYGADTQYQRQSAAMQTTRPAPIRTSSFSKMTASLSEFYSWVAQQAGHTVAMQSTTRTTPLPVLRQVCCLRDAAFLPVLEMHGAPFTSHFWSCCRNPLLSK